MQGRLLERGEGGAGFEVAGKRKKTKRDTCWHIKHASRRSGALIGTSLIRVSTSMI